MTVPEAPRMHGCPGGCGTQIGPARYACRACWRRLPLDLRTAITATFRAELRGEHRAAMQVAHEWFKTHRAGVPRGKS